MRQAAAFGRKEFLAQRVGEFGRHYRHNEDLLASVLAAAHRLAGRETIMPQKPLHDTLLQAQRLDLAQLHRMLVRCEQPGVRAQGAPIEEQLKIVITQKRRCNGHDHEQQNHADENRDADRDTAGRVKLYAIGGSRPG